MIFKFPRRWFHIRGAIAFVITLIILRLLLGSVFSSAEFTTNKAFGVINKALDVADVSLTKTRDTIATDPVETAPVAEGQVAEPSPVPETE